MKTNSEVDFIIKTLEFMKNSKEDYSKEMVALNNILFKLIAENGADI